jgi:hypothetical protein
MGKKVDVDDLVNSEDIGHKLDLSRQRIHQLAKSDATFPAPAFNRSGVTLWLWPAVEKWAKATGRYPITTTDTD